MGSTEKGESEGKESSQAQKTEGAERFKMSASLCQQIKEKLSLRDVARLVGIELPERDGKKFCSPLRPDRNPSCEVWRDTLRDRSSGESLDAIALYGAARDLTPAEAIRELAAYLGIERRGSSAAKQSFKESTKKALMKPRSTNSKVKSLNIATCLQHPSMPEEIPWSKELAQSIVESRGLSLGGIQVARALGTLSAGMVHGFPSWILTDREAPGWESRRIDGLNYPAVSDLGVRKSHARGKVKSWPVGICPPKLTDQECAEHLPKILLCEGGPDFLAGCCIAEAIREIDVLPVTMLGKSSNIAEAALPFFAGRRVVIAGHGDASDRVQAWASQIEPSSRSVTVSLCPEGQDLNDLIKAGCSPADLYASLFPL